MRHDELRAAGVRLVAVAHDDRERLESFVDDNEIAYPVLVDPNGAVIERWGIRNREHTSGILPDPASFVVDRDGIVRWKQIDEDYTVRPPVGELLEAVRECCTDER